MSECVSEPGVAHASRLYRFFSDVFFNMYLRRHMLRVYVHGFLFFLYSSREVHKKKKNRAN